MASEPVLEHIEKHQQTYLDNLFELLAQRSISSTGEGIEECARLCARYLEEAGFDAQILPSRGNPVVYGERIVDPAAFTLLVYGHYDVQPVDPLSEWVSAPFEPTLRDGRIYARGVGDNKGQFLANILGARALREVHGELPINVKFILDGEEEQGSPHLPEFVRDHQDLLDCDAVFTADGPQHASARPTINFGVRGIAYLQLDAKGASRDNHSGNRGNIAPNPAFELIKLFSSMVDDNGHVTIPGFYDDVIPPNEDDQKLIDALPFDPDAAAQSMGMDSMPYAKNEFYNRLMFLPTFNVSGISSGYQGEGSKTVIPSTAQMKIDIRLVLDQDPEKIISLVREYIAQRNPGVRVTDFGFMAPSRSDSSTPFSRAVISTAREVYGQEPVVTPSAGGSLPDYVWTKILGRPSVQVPYGNPDQGNHGPNESMKPENYFNGIRNMASLLLKLKKVFPQSSAVTSEESR